MLGKPPAKVVHTALYICAHHVPMATLIIRIVNTPALTKNAKSVDVASMTRKLGVKIKKTIVPLSPGGLLSLLPSSLSLV